MMSGMNYFDCHADTLTEIPQGESLEYNNRNLDLARVRAFAEHYIQVFAIWKDRMQMANPEAEFMQLYDRAVSLLLASQKHIALCKSSGDMKRALEAGKAAAFLAVEDISIMGKCVKRVKELGISIAMLTWNYANPYGAGAVFAQERGLTREGRELVELLLRQQVILDLSHLSDAGVEDVFLATEKPVIASHSNVRSICNHPRNLSKAHIREIIRRGGIIGVNYYRPFVEESAEGWTALFRHVDAILNLGGEDALVLGSDFDGCGNQFAADICGVESVPLLWQKMERAGFDRKLMQKIFWKNGYEFLFANT